MKSWRVGVIMAAWLAALVAPGASLAEEAFPNRPVRVVIPYSPGSVADVFARIIGQNMAMQWNASIVVENRAPTARLPPRKSRAPRRTGTRGCW
jgi:tripartite-type tricarboxylate transporter receptor subunit TctC